MMPSQLRQVRVFLGGGCLCCFFSGAVLHFALSWCFCALVIWPSRLSSHCEAEEQKDGSNSLCATPQAKAAAPSPPLHYLQTHTLDLSGTPLPFPSSLARAHRPPGEGEGIVGDPLWILWAGPVHERWLPQGEAVGDGGPCIPNNPPPPPSSS